ncbi:C-type lectin 37Db-like [Drosophila innubila]|uniref:C-type lectin 37Db-like n=1 Tax=Drosophila innubila TaxID=198719 RepID=UPI00148E12FF|nr:C-type lectin 37Db-like [Drosophila innubila]
MLGCKLIGFAILSLVLTQLEFAQGHDSGCTNKFSKVGDKCLYLISYINTNWHNADRHCHSLGAGLLSFQNQRQLKQIEDWLDQNDTWSNEFWTSGNSFGHKGVYYWQSTGEKASYLPWSLGQPRPNQGDCLVLNSKPSSTTSHPYETTVAVPAANSGLYVENCSAVRSYICEQIKN